MARRTADHFDLLLAPEARRVNSRRAWLRLGATFLLLGAAAWLGALLASPAAWWVHGTWCAVGIVIAVPTLARALRLGVASVLSDHLIMFLGAFTIYFLFGALLLAVGPKAEVEYSMSYYPIDAREAMRVNSVNGLGFGLALMTAALSRGRWLARQTGALAQLAARVPNYVTLLLFLILGAAASFRVVLVDLGVREGIVPGIWRTAAKFVIVAIFLGVAHRGRRGMSVRLLAVLLAIASAVLGLLLFDKTATLLPLAALAAGSSVRYRPRFIMPASLVVLVVTFVFLGRPLAYGRNTIRGEGGNIVEARWWVLREGLANPRISDANPNYHPWSRLCYVPSQAAALAFYDAGRGGDDLRLIPWLLVPRALAPSKPSITQTSADFHTKITGSRGSSTGQGIFASGYYSSGWVGVLLASVLCGWILAQTSAIARTVVARRAMFLLPFAFLGVYMAFRIDGHFVADYLGQFVFVLYPLLAASAIPRTGRRGRSQRS